MVVFLKSIPQASLLLIVCFTAAFRDEKEERQLECCNRRREMKKPVSYGEGKKK